MTEEEWKKYTILLSLGMQAMTKEQLQSQACMNSIANVAFHTLHPQLLQNALIPPKVITDRIWNEDIW